MSQSRRGVALVRDDALSVDEAMAAVRGDAAGAVVVFVGMVRDHDGGRGVDALDYSAHPAAQETLAALVDEIGTRPGVEAVAAYHRTGHLAVGDSAVILAVAGRHRAEAFEGCRELIERLKAGVPIWKHQVFGDGTDEWVGTP